MTKKKCDICPALLQPLLSTSHDRSIRTHYRFGRLCPWIYKKCPDKFLMGFKFWSSWGSWSKISELQQVGDFSKNGSQLHRRSSVFLRPYSRVGLNVARYLTVSLRGPVLTLRRGALRRVSRYSIVTTILERRSLQDALLSCVQNT